MPPEAFEGKSDACGDVYSLGLTLYELLTLRPAFDERERNRLIKQVTHEEPARLRKLNRQVPRDLETIIHKAIDKEPRQRYASAGALAEDLRRFTEDEPVKARRTSVAERGWRWCRHNPALAVLAAAVPVLLGGVAVVSSVSAFRIAGARDAALRAQANEAGQRQRAEESAEESRQRLVLAQVAAGARLVEQGDLHGALPWFAEALRLDQGDPAREESHRLRLAATLQRSPKLVALWSTEAGPGGAAFCPDGRQVAVSGPGGVQVWDTAAGKLRVAFAKGADLTDIAFAPEGNRVATAGRDGTARLWALDTGRPITPPLRHGGAVNRVAFSPDGRRLVTASDDKTARLWDAGAGTQLGTLPQGEAVQCASFSPDGKRVVTRAGGTISVWDVTSGRLVTSFYADMSVVLQEAVFSADGRRIIVTGGQRILRTWDADSGRLLSQAPQGGLSWLSPDRRLVVSAGLIVNGDYGTPCRVWDADTAQLVTPPLEQTHGTVECAFSPQGDRLITIGADATVRVCDIETAGIVAGPFRHGSAVTSAAFSPDGRLLVTRESAGLVRIWDMAGGTSPASPLKLSISPPNSGWFSPDGRWAVKRSPGGYAWLWDTRAGQFVKTVHEEGWVASAAVTADGGRFVTGHMGGLARIWDAATGTPVGQPLRHRGCVSHVEFSPDERRVVTTSEDRTACVWDAATENRLAEMKHEHAVRWAAFSADGRRLVTATGDFSSRGYATLGELLAPQSDPGKPGEARVWDAATGRPVTPPMQHEGVVVRAALSPDGRFILTTCVSRAANRYQVRVWDAASGQALIPPLMHPQTVFHETFSPDGRLVATGCADGAARVWDAVTGAALLVLPKHGGPVRHLAFSPDARRLLTASDDGTARIWDVATGQPIAVLRHDRGVQFVAFAPDGHSVITGCVDATVRTWPLALDRRPANDWVALATMLTGGGTDASKSPGREPDWIATWQTLRAKYPNDFATTKAEQLAWHCAALESASRKKAWPAALAHLGRLADIDPADWQDRLARARLLARLVRWAEAEAEFTRAVEGHAGVVPVWVARGSFYLGRGQRERAEADFVRAIGLRASAHLPAVLSEFWVAGLYPEDLKRSFHGHRGGLEHDRIPRRPANGHRVDRRHQACQGGEVGPAVS